MPDKKIQKNIPQHVGIIIDGNRRWARERNLPIFEGHQKGYEKMKQAPEWFFSRGVKILSFYAFSTENWNRAQDEVNYLMKLLKRSVEASLLEQAKKNGFKVLVSGRLEELPGDLPALCLKIMAETKANNRGIVNICLNYGGRAEIVDAVKRIAEKVQRRETELQAIDDSTVSEHLYTAGLPDPDLLIRTGGEVRLSNFLLWQVAYAELWVTPVYWPDFRRGHLYQAIADFQCRERRFGGVKAK